MTADFVSDATPPALDVIDVATLLRCSQRTVEKLERDGRIPRAARLGGLRRWSRAVLLDWIDRGMPIPTEGSSRA